jgi:hypothetical protein
VPLYAISPPAISRVASATSAAPGAGSNVASIAAPPAGSYRLKVMYILTGTQETAALNVRVRANGAGLIDLPTGQAVGAASVITVDIGRIDCDGVNVVSAGAVAAATGGSVYTITLILDRIG